MTGLAAADEHELRRHATMRAIALRAGSSHMPAARGRVRLVASAATPAALADALDAYAAQQPSAAVQVHLAPLRPRLAVLCSGQSDVYAGMARVPCAHSAAFAGALERCDAVVELPGATLRALLDGSAAGASFEDARVAQPALFALQAALVALWADWGVTPDAVGGHSLGEYAAAHAAEALTLEDGIALVAERGALTQRLASGGRMVAVLTDAETAWAAIRADGGPVEIAALNAPEVVTLSGPHEHVARVAASLAAQDVPVTRLDTTHAFHSVCMNTLLEPLAQAAARVPFTPPRIPFASALEGRLLTDDEALDGSYWVRHLRQPVRFRDTVRALAEAGCTAFLELGPHATLTRLGARCLPAGDVQWVPSLRRGVDQAATLRAAAQQLWLAGFDVDLARVARDVRSRASSRATA
jgi:acyl transferase domain-containing protein